MSLLILPRPERVTMPAAILPRPSKKIEATFKHGTNESLPQVEKVETNDDVVAPAVEKLELSFPEIESAVTPTETSSTEIATTRTMHSAPDAARLLLQIFDLLRVDEKALVTLKSLADGLGSKAKPETEKMVKSEYMASTDISTSNDVIRAPPEEDIARAAVESRKPTGSLNLQASVVSGVVQVPEESPKVVQHEMVVYPRKSKEHSKSKERSHKDKSKHSKHFLTAINAETHASIVRPGFTAVDVVDEELTRDDLWYHIPETKEHDDVDILPKRTYTLQDVKEYASRNARHVRKLYEPPPFPMEGKIPFPINPLAGSAKAYEATFQKVDATDDLGVTSKPKDDSAMFKKSIDLKSAAKSVAQKKSVSVDPPTTPTTPVMFDFNPPTPRRVTRRVVLSSKEAGTQTCAPSSSVAKAQSISQPRPVATHLQRYYNNPICLDPKSSKCASKTRAPFTAEELATLPASWCGSDEVFMRTLKNVDAGDDLIIVSRPKEEEQKVQSPRVEKIVPVEKTGPLESTVTIDSTSALHESLVKAISQDNGILYALLSALPKSSGGAPPSPPVESTAEKKRKKEKKEKSSAEGKVRKSKSKKGIASEISEAEILGDLLGDEIPKWGILNPNV